MTASLRLLLGYFHAWPNDAGPYVARAAGLYDHAGVDLRIEVGDPGRGDTIAHLARGEADLALVPSNRLLAARARGERLVAVAAINQTGLEVIHSLRSLGITRPRDLAGRRVALNPTPRGVAMVRHLVEVDGGNPDLVELVDSGHREWQSSDLAAGHADAYFGAYWCWDELFDAHDPADRAVFPVKDHGAPPFHSYLLAAREDLIDARPGLVTAVVAATGAGYERAAADPGSTARLLAGVVPWFGEDVLRRSTELVAPTWFHDGRWGEVRDELLAPYARWLVERGAIPSLAGLPGAVAQGGRRDRTDAA